MWVVVVLQFGGRVGQRYPGAENLRAILAGGTICEGEISCQYTNIFYSAWFGMKTISAYVMSQYCCGTIFRTPLALGETDGISGPVIYQLMQVISEGSFSLLGVGSHGGGHCCLCRGDKMVLGMTWTICDAGLTQSWKTTDVSKILAKDSSRPLWQHRVLPDLWRNYWGWAWTERTWTSSRMNC